MKILTVTGFLGAGKTSTVLQIAHRLTDDGTSVGVLVNDTGEVSLDGVLLRGEDVHLVELFAGCLCLMQEDLFSGLARLASEPDIGWVLIEPSGMANSIRMRRLVEQFATATSDKFAVSRTRTAAVIDVERYRSLNRSIGHLLYRSIQAADHVILSKVDIARARELAYVEDRVKRINPRAALSMRDGPDDLPAETIEQLIA